MIISLVLSTAIYIVLTLVLTGIVDYRKFEGIGDPLSFIFAPQNANIPWMEFVVSVTAIVAITTVLLVFQMGQPRIWMSMSRDGLMPKNLQKFTRNTKHQVSLLLLQELLLVYRFYLLIKPLF